MSLSNYFVLLTILVIELQLFLLSHCRVRRLYLDSYKTCNQLDYVVDDDQTFTVTGERRPEVNSNVFIKCHMTFKSRYHTGKICFTLLRFKMDERCLMKLILYDGDSDESGQGEVLTCNTEYNYPYTWCTSGQYGMLVLDRVTGPSTVRDMEVDILVQYVHNRQKTVYLDSGCSNAHPLDHSTVLVSNRHRNSRPIPPERCDLTFDYVGEGRYPVCVRMSYVPGLLPPGVCPFYVSVWEGEPEGGDGKDMRRIDGWTCDKTYPPEICTEGPVLTVTMERKSEEPVGLFNLTVQDRSPAPPDNTTGVIIGVSVGIGVAVILIVLYLMLAVYLENKKGVYIGPCCICRKYCKNYTDESMSTATEFTHMTDTSKGYV